MMTLNECELRIEEHKHLIGNEYVQMNSGKTIQLIDLLLFPLVDEKGEITDYTVLCLFDNCPIYKTVETLDLILAGRLYRKV